MSLRTRRMDLPIGVIALVILSAVLVYGVATGLRLDTFPVIVGLFSGYLGSVSLILQGWFARRERS